MGRSPALDALLKITQDLFEKEATGLVNYVGSQVQRLWKTQAIALARHRSWGEKYAEAIELEPADSAGGTARVFVDESKIDKSTKKPNMMFVNMVENGIQSWSIRDALLKSARVKRAADGYRYITVPFRWRTPSSVKGTATVFTGTMPNDIYRAVKSGVKLVGKEFGAFSGLTRYGSSLHGKYFTFRTVSERVFRLKKTRGDAPLTKADWQYPDVAPTPVFERVEGLIGKLIDSILADYVANVAKDLPEAYRKAMKL